MEDQLRVEQELFGVGDDSRLERSGTGESDDD